MKTESFAPATATPLLRVVYQQTFNEEHIRIPQAKVQKMKPIFGWEYRTHEAVSEKDNWDLGWFASYE